ncbi:hypothetical protein GCM10009582_24820 [Arthrobacter flavus]
MGVPAELNVEPRVRGIDEVRGHDGCRPAEEGKGGLSHSLISQWNEFRDPALFLSMKNLQRVRPVRGWAPCSVA